ncbi:hypothetical protein ACQPXT_13385 [Streptomyces sp. CA-100214]
MSCSRLTRHRRPCRATAADWPAYEGMPAPVPACWTHLTAAERELCTAARARRNLESRERLERMLAEQAERGEPGPQPVYREARPCVGRCITRADLRDREGPGYDHSDSDMVTCAHCDESVCILCRGRDHMLGTRCTSASAVGEDAFPQAGAEGIDHGPNPRARLNGLVTRLAHVTGEGHAAVNARINRAVGVASRVGAEETVIRRAVVVAREWLASEERGSPTAADR